jgi:hypothetical protein
MRTLPPDGPLDADRSSIDEALFANQPAFFPSGVPELPAEALPGFLAPVTEPAPLPFVPVDAEPCGAVRDGGAEYQMTGLAPGLFELRAVPSVPPAEPAVEQEVEEPVWEDSPEPPRVPCELAANAGLSLTAGEEVSIGPGELCIVGPAEKELIDILVLAPPEHGALLRDGFALSAGDTFTQADLEAGRVRYRHDGGEGDQDSFTFATAEGDVQPALFVLTIEPLPQAPLAAPVEEKTAVDLEEELALLPTTLDGPPQEEFIPEEPAPPPRVPRELAVNAGLTLAPGKEVAIGPGELCIVGPDEKQLIEVLVLAPPAHGALLREGFALAAGDTFTQEDVDAGRIRYRHDGDEARQDRFTFATADGDVPPAEFLLTIQPVWRAPELLGPGQLAGVLDGCRVAGVLAGQAHCHEAEQAGLALVGVAGKGQWYWSPDGMGSWHELGEVRPGRALLLGPDDWLRFVPREGWSGTVKVSYRAWDGSSGQPGDVIDLAPRGASGGATAFSAAIQTAVLHLPPPVLTCRADPCREEPTLGELVGTGLAVVRLEGQGSWQYSLDDGLSWRPFGVIYHGRARLLRDTDRVRFLPRPGAAGKVLLGGRPWDGEGGAPGGTANLATRASHGDDSPFGEFIQTRTWWLRS